MYDENIVTKVGYFDDKVVLWTIDNLYNGKISVFKNNSTFIETITSEAGKIPNAELDMLVEKLKGNELYRKYDEGLKFIAITGYDKAVLSFEWTTKNGVDEYDIVADVNCDIVYEYLDIPNDCTVLAIRSRCGCKVLNLSHCKNFKGIRGTLEGVSHIYTNKIIFPSDLDIGISKLIVEGIVNSESESDAPEIEFVGNNKINVSDSLIYYTDIVGEFKELSLLSRVNLDNCVINGTVTIDVDAINKWRRGKPIGLYNKKIGPCNIKELQLEINNEFVKYNNVSRFETGYKSYTVHFLDGKVIKKQISYE